MERFFDFIAQPTRDLQGTVDGVLVHAVDVTESVLARRKLQEADRRKDEFLAMLGHELRNPLAPILTALQLMALRHNADGADRERAVIERQVSTLSRLVDDILDVCQATTGKIALHREPLELATAVARAVEITRPLIDSKHHELKLSVPQTGLLMDGDPMRLSQVFANLLNNAAKYTNPGGDITVEGSQED